MEFKFCEPSPGTVIGCQSNPVSCSISIQAHVADACDAHHAVEGSAACTIKSTATLAVPKAKRRRT